MNSNDILAFVAQDPNQEDKEDKKKKKKITLGDMERKIMLEKVKSESKINMAYVSVLPFNFPFYFLPCVIFFSYLVPDRYSLYIEDIPTCPFNAS